MPKHQKEYPLPEDEKEVFKKALIGLNSAPVPNVNGRRGKVIND